MWEVAIYYLTWMSASSPPVKSTLWYVNLSVLLTFSSWPFTKPNPSLSLFRILKVVAWGEVKCMQNIFQKFEKSELSITSPIHFIISVKCLPLGDKHSRALWRDMDCKLLKVPLIENHCNRNSNAYACTLMDCHCTSCYSTVMGGRSDCCLYLVHLSVFSTFITLFFHCWLMPAVKPAVFTSLPCFPTVLQL